MRDLTSALIQWLAHEPVQVGEIVIRPVAAGYELRHYLDAEEDALETLAQLEDARRLSLYTAAGEFRPLKSAPNLRRGWRLALADARALRRALDALYPAMAGLWWNWQAGSVEAVPLRATLERQSGMYAVTRKATDDELQQTVGAFCQSETGCLKTILWNIAEDLPVTTLPAAKFSPEANQTGADRRCLPMLCHEACNLLVGRLREVVKSRPAAS